MYNFKNDSEVIKIPQEALSGLNNNVLIFFISLIELIQNRVKYTQRYLGSALTSGMNLIERVESCRDLTILFMETSRCLGVPSRFVGGCQHMDKPPEKYELHAWI